MKVTLEAKVSDDDLETFLCQIRDLNNAYPQFNLRIFMDDRDPPPGDILQIVKRVGVPLRFERDDQT